MQTHKYQRFRNVLQNPVDAGPIFTWLLCAAHSWFNQGKSLFGVKKGLLRFTQFTQACPPVAAKAVSALSIAHKEETAPALAITLAAEAAAALAHLEVSAPALNTALAKKKNTGLAILRVERAATVLIIALAEDNDKASALAFTTQAETSVFAITLLVEEPDTRISIVSAEAPATALAIALSEEPATAIMPVAEGAPALDIVLVNVTIAVLFLLFLKEGAIICEEEVTAELSIVVDCPADNW